MQDIVKTFGVAGINWDTQRSNSLSSLNRTYHFSTMHVSHAYLRREPENEHDPNAMAVDLELGGQRVAVGYMPAKHVTRRQPKRS